ncbi:MAG: superfamily protein-like exporter [Solirubrobacterales bacterium]|nr:superfamily protein-like exporter [Solirubrobacterales bacterium]
MVSGAARRPLVVLAATALLVVAGALFALRLEPSAATDTLVGSGTPEYRATQEFHQKFGDDAVYVLVQGPLSKLVLTSDLERLVALEGCIGGNVPKGVAPLGGAHSPCAALARTKPVKVVFGPGTFINESVAQISDEFSAQTKAAQADTRRVQIAARKLALARGMSRAQANKLGNQAAQLRQTQFFTEIAQLAIKYGLKAPPTLQDTTFVSQLVFGKKAGCPKAKFAYLFPTCDAALVQVRLKPELTDNQRKSAIGLIRQAVAMPDWQPRNGARYVVTGVPVVVNDLTDSITRSIELLLVAVLLVMAGTLAVVFRARARLLPLVVALAAAALTFGGLSVAGASLTMASIAVLPVLIGLAVDYAIQFQSRVEETGDVRRAAQLGGPTILTAGAATAAGFLVLALSPVPMVQGFGVLLVIGVVLAFVATFTAGVAMLSLLGRRSTPGPIARIGERLAPAWRGAGELLTQNPPVRLVGRAGSSLGHATLRLATTRPERVLAVALLAAAAGWVAHTQTRVESDVQKLVPQDLRALRDLRTLQDATGVGGEIDLMVSSDNLTTPETVAWMSSYQKKLLDHYGYSVDRGCGKADLCPAFSLPDLFSGGATSTSEINGLLDAVPAYFSQGVITSDRKTATLAFGIRLMPLEKQQAVLDTMRRDLDPPQGVSAQLVGLPVLAAEANARVSSSGRRALQLVAGLLAVALILLVALRSVRRALVPLVPIAMATGWSALVLYLTRIPLNPMSVTLGALVIAISTEFSVLLSERYRQERAAGHAPGEALARTYASTGRAVTASGVTAIAGFAVLIVSDITMLRDFGLVTVIDLTVSLLGVLAVLPAALLLEERGVRVPRPALPRRLARARS